MIYAFGVTYHILYLRKHIYMSVICIDTVIFIIVGSGLSMDISDAM